MFRKVFLDPGREIFCKFLTLPDSVEQERTTLAKTACHVIHVQIGLYMACDKIGGCHQIGRTDGFVTKTQVGTGETA